MFTAINIYQTYPYRSPRDPDKSNPTVFTLGVLDPFIEGYIRDRSRDIEYDPTNPQTEGKIKICFALYNFLVVKFGVRAIDPFLSYEGQPFKIDLEEVNIHGRTYKALPDSVIFMLGSELISELAEKVQDINHLSEQEKKT